MAHASLLACVLTTAAALFTADAGGAEQTLYFAHDDERLLLDNQRHGGAAFFSTAGGHDRALPLIVFLHGTNEAGELHLWMGGGKRDLRPLASDLVANRKAPPFVLAAPSQTRAAGVPRALWEGFDLARFVGDVARATAGRVAIDGSRVVVIGHSGAGCNPTGGLAGAASSSSVPAFIVSVDPCLDAEMGGVFARRPSSVPLSVWWQSAVWARSPDRFWAALTAKKPTGRVDRMTKLPVRGADAHDAIVPLVLERVASSMPFEAAKPSK